MTDLGSRGGTWVNGRRVDTADLLTGDVVKVGSTVLRVNRPAGRQDHHRTATHVGPAIAPPTAPDGPAAIPAIPGYRLDGVLGKGGMGVVYRGVHIASGDPVAVKTILPAIAPTPVAVGRFRRESDILQQLAHPHVVAGRGSGEADGLLYAVMEYVPGRTAADIVKAEGPLAPDRALVWAGQLLDALAHAHDLGFVHRDVKPSNIMIADVDGAEHIKLADFGLARAYEASGLSGLTTDRALGGTPQYIPPEQVTDFRGAGPAADQYAAAATLYYLLTGDHVYGPTKLMTELLMRVLSDEPIPLRPDAKALPDPFGPVVRKALSRDPKHRYKDVSCDADGPCRLLTQPGRLCFSGQLGL